MVGCKFVDFLQGTLAPIAMVFQWTVRRSKEWNGLELTGDGAIRGGTNDIIHPAKWRRSDLDGYFNPRLEAAS